MKYVLLLFALSACKPSDLSASATRAELRSDVIEVCAEELIELSQANECEMIDDIAGRVGHLGVFCPKIDVASVQAQLDNQFGLYDDGMNATPAPRIRVEERGFGVKIPNAGPTDQQEIFYDGFIIQALDSQRVTIVQCE